MAAPQRPISPPEWDLILSYSQKNWPDKIVDLVTNQGVDPNHSNAVGQTALHIASLWGHVNSVRVLLECGADPNAQNRLMGSTPLHMVAQSHKAKLDDALAVVDLLVAHGADLNLPDRGGTLPANSVGLDGDPSKRPLVEKLQPQKPPLVESIATAHVSRVQELLGCESSAASVNQLYTGKTAALFALDRLIDRAQDATSNGTGTAGGGDADGEKDAACQDVTSLLSILELLVGKGGQLSAAGGKSSSAESLEDPPPVPRLLEELRIAYKHLDSSEPLDGASHWAEPVAHALEGAILLLVETLKVPVTQECTDCLHQACRRNERRMAQFMVERLKVDPNTRGRQGMTPLQFAARSGQMLTLNYLLSLPDLDAALRDDRGQTALDAARVNDKKEALQALEEYLSSKTR